MENILIKIVIILAVLCLIVLIRGIWETKHFVITCYDVKTDKNDFKESKIVLLTDLHCNTFGKDNIKLFDAISKINPDLILIAGDMIVGKEGVDFISTAKFINNLSTKYMVVYGMGNHEEKLKNHQGLYQNYISMLSNVPNRDIKTRKYGLFIVDNESVLYSNNIVISGLSLEKKYFGSNREVLDCSIIEEKLTPLDRSKYNILIAHNPEHFEAYALSGANLIVSGHNHGGTVRIPLIGGLISTSFKLFPRYDKGIYEKDDTSKMIVSGGLGAHTINFRLFNRPEIVVINLK